MSRLLLPGLALALACGTAAPLHSLPTDTVAAGLGARLDSALRAAAQRGFSGVVRVQRGDTLLLRKGYGLANRDRQIPFSDESVIQIGSNTKDFTLVTLLRLQQRGRLSLRDSLGKYFPAAPAEKRGITLQQLVEHRGGFPIGLGGDFESLTRDQFLQRAFATPLRAQPGTREIYSNTGYAILAAVIEKVTGRSYDEHVRNDVLVPLGLENTGYLLPRFDPERVAHGYANGEDRGNTLLKPHAADGPYWNLRGNGGMLSTVEDMHAFYRALFGGERLLLLHAIEQPILVLPDHLLGSDDLVLHRLVFLVGLDLHQLALVLAQAALHRGQFLVDVAARRLAHLDPAFDGGDGSGALDTGPGR